MNLFEQLRMKNILTKILIGCTAVVAVYSVIWVIYANVVFSPYIKALGGKKTAVIDGYEFSVFTPTYPSFSGNLAVNEIKNGRDVYNETSAGLLIWPGFNGKYRVHVMVETPTEIYDDYHSGSNIYGFEMNAEMKPDLSTEEYADNFNDHKEFFEENRDKIEDMLKKTRSAFNISL